MAPALNNSAVFYNNSRQASVVRSASYRSSKLDDEKQTTNERNKTPPSLEPEDFDASAAPPIEDVYTSQLLLRHPRSLLIVTSISLCIGVHIFVFGLICLVYDGCPYATGLWAGIFFTLSATLGIVFIKLRTTVELLWTYLTTSSIGIVLSVALFVVIAYFLGQEERFLEDKWDYSKQEYWRLNRIVESIKLTMFALQLILASLIAIFQITTVSLLATNARQVNPNCPTRAYYIAESQVGHQMLLVPVNVNNTPLVRRKHEPELREFIVNLSVGTQTLEIETGQNSSCFIRYSSIDS